MPCQERIKLFSELRNAMRRYATLVKQLSDLAGQIPNVEFDLLNRQVSRAHEACLEARKKFQSHSVEHRC